jgi:eukaryotic-like serine/threonine-protein kinase
VKLPQPDMIIAGKYRLEGQLAEGGMGSVWIGHHCDLDLPVAVKFMGPECASSEEGRIRFEREAKAAAFLQSPHVVNVQDYGVDDGLAYIVMELLVGEDLEERLHRVKRLSLEDTLNILTQAAKALRRAQELGIVHRDIKPENFFLASGDDGDEHLKVLDFGIAKETGPVLLAKKGTNTGQIIGSPHYMSPEHVRGARDIDHRADLWSLGVILFQAVTGRRPFSGDNVGDVMAKIVADPIPRPTEVAPDLPAALDDFFKKALARDRNERFQTAREMAEAFAEIVRAQSPESIKFSLSTPPPPVVAAELAAAAKAAANKDESLAPASIPAVAATGAGNASAPVSSAAAAPSLRSRAGVFAGAIALIAVVAGLLIVLRGQVPGSGSSGASQASAQPAGDPVKEQVPVPTAQPTAAAAPAPAGTSTEGPAGQAAPGATGSAAATGKAAPGSGKGPRSAAPKASSKPNLKLGF